MKRHEEKCCLFNFKGFAQIEINDIGLFRVVFVDETAQRCRYLILFKMLKFNLDRNESLAGFNHKIHLGFIFCPPVIQLGGFES